MPRTELSDGIVPHHESGAAVRPAAQPTVRSAARLVA